MEDEEIVGLFLSRDESAIRKTAEKYGPRLYRLSFGITGERMTAEECENDTYLEAWNRIPPQEPKTYFYAFLARITRHISIDRCRSRSALKRDGFLTDLSDELAEILPSPETAETELDGKLLGEAVSRFLGTLPKEKRRMFVGRYFHMESLSSVASRLGVTESKVKTTLFRIRRDLRTYLLKEGFSL